MEPSVLPNRSDIGGATLSMLLHQSRGSDSYSSCMLVSHKCCIFNDLCRIKLQTDDDLTTVNAADYSNTPDSRLRARLPWMTGEPGETSSGRERASRCVWRRIEIRVCRVRIVRVTRVGSDLRVEAVVRVGRSESRSCYAGDFLGTMTACPRRRGVLAGEQTIMHSCLLSPPEGVGGYV